MNQNELTVVLERAAGRLDPDVAGLVTGGVQRGQRKVRRRRAAILATGSAVTALVVGAVAWQSSLGPTTAHDRTTARPTPPAPTPARTAGLTPDDQRSLAPDDVVLERFLRQLPAGRINDLRMTPVDDPTGAYQHSLVIDLRLAGADIRVRLHDMSAKGKPFSARKACGTRECRRLEGGSWLWPRSGDGGDGSDRSGFTGAWAGVFAPDGWMIDVSAFNGVGSTPQTPAVVVSDAPPLTLDQLTALATSDIWFS
jgi:hypothetical protein